MPLVPGSRFGDFDVVRELGAGAMGAVYLAEDPRIERRVAIKTVRLRGEDEAGAAALRGRLAREAKAAGRLVHPHIVTLFEAGECEGVLYLAFEYVAGSDLAARMRQPPPLTVAAVTRIARQAASGLAAAHRHGIVHRDIKPSNLLLNEDGDVKIADFGIAKLAAGQDAELTASGMVVGTPAYLSPEQIRGNTLDGRSDLFSLGVVIYHLLARERPFEGDTMSALCYQVLEHHPPLVSERRPDVPARLAAAVARLLAKDPGSRFQSAEALIDELTAIEREHVDVERVPGADDPTLADERLAPTIAATVVAQAAPPAPSLGSDASPDVAPRASAPAPRASLPAALAIVVALLTTAGLAGLGFWWAGDADTGTSTSTSSPRNTSSGAGGSPAAATPAPDTRSLPPERPGAATAESPAPSAPAPPTHDPPAPEPSAAPTSSDEAEPPARIVGRAVTFAITPAAAARAAVVKVDGLVRGPAAGSVLTLLPGRHQIEIVAAGYEPHVLRVESHDGAAGSEPLTIAMRAREP